MPVSRCGESPKVGFVWSIFTTMQVRAWIAACRVLIPFQSLAQQGQKAWYSWVWKSKKKMEHHASLPRFSFRGLLSFVFSAETILFGLLSLQVLDLAETGNRCGKLRLLLLMSRGMFEWTFISLLHMCLSVSSFRQRETQGHVGKRNVKSVHRVNVLQERQRSTFEAVKP